MARLPKQHEEPEAFSRQLSGLATRAWPLKLPRTFPDWHSLLCVSQGSREHHLVPLSGCSLSPVVCHTTLSKQQAPQALDTQGRQLSSVWSVLQKCPGVGTSGHVRAVFLWLLFHQGA